MSIGDRFDTAAVISRQISVNFGKEVSRRLSQVRLKALPPVIKPLISKTHNVARLVFAEEHVTCTYDNLFKVHFSDERKLNLVGSYGHQYVRRITEKILLSKCVKKTVKIGRGSVMGWSMFSAAEEGPLVRLNSQINANMYQNFLQQHAILPLQAYPNQPANFMQDNDSCHTARRIKKFLDDVGIEILKWPRHSPDLNAIKNQCKIIGEKVMAKKNIHNY